MTSKPVLFLIGSGANIGASTVKTFLANGYKVAQASRSAKNDDSTLDNLHVALDITKPDTSTEAFKTVRQNLGEPSIVIYNAAAYHNGGAENTLFHASVDEFATDLTANVTSVFVAAREAITSFSKLDGSKPKMFAFTGNLLNEQKPLPGLLTLGVGKSATAYLIAEANAVYKPKGYNFYYVDERVESGAPPYNNISGPGHAEFFSSLAEGKAGDVPWQATFVSGRGYTQFPLKQCAQQPID